MEKENENRRRLRLKELYSPESLWLAVVLFMMVPVPKLTVFGIENIQGTHGKMKILLNEQEVLCVEL